MSRILPFILYLALLLLSLGAAAFGVLNYFTTTRGIEPASPPASKIIGTNVALEQYATDADLQRALTALTRAHISHARQYFPWREIEPQQGAYNWAKWDRIVNAARANGITLIAVLDTAPPWSQRPNERDMPNAPPDDFTAFAGFAAAFSQRYGSALQYYQIWDEPNVEPHWGKRNADPVEYARLLIPASDAIRAADPDAVILLAGLAMNLELHRPHPNYSEILFLRGLYEIGANRYWDIVAAKPYGMWSGPEDRTVNSAVLNFSRLILLRDEMRQYGDAAKPIWAVEMGWNALPPQWNGQPSPWGTDAEVKQTDRLLRGLARTRSEWSWLTGEFPNILQPNVSADNPRWGFSLLTPEFMPRASYNALTAFLTSPPEKAPPPTAPFVPIALLCGVALISAWRAWHYTFAAGLDKRWRALKARAIALPEWAQVFVVILTALAFYLSASVPLNFALSALLIFLIALQLPLGIALILFTIPFWNFPKTLFGGFELSTVEAFTWITTAAFLLDALLTKRFALDTWRLPSHASPIPSGSSRITRRPSLTGSQSAVPGPHPSLLSSLTAPDLAALTFLLLGLVSTRWAGNFGVASREFRIIVLDPILLYALLRLGPVSARARQWYINVLFASGAVVSCIGIYQYLSGDVILADGVARLTAVWGSPNNVGLYLGRLLPIALSLVVLWRGARARWVYAVLVILFAVTIFLTFSRGAILLGVPAAVFFILIVLFSQSHHLSRRAWLVVGAALLLGALALIPLLLSERGQSFFQTGTGTAFFRVAVWTSALNMIRDHPLLGVGLDNFLYEYPKYILPEAWREPNLSHPHNFILDFWVRLGVGGLLIFLWMLLLFFKRAWHTFKTTPDNYTRALLLGLMASVVNMLAHGLIDAAYFVVDLAYLFFLTLALAQANFAPSDTSHKTPDNN